MSNLIHLEVSIDEQRLDVSNRQGLIRSYAVSTGKKGVGFREGSYRTPVGRFRISEKIGGDQPRYTIFKQRVPVGVGEREAAPDALLAFDPAGAATRGFDRRDDAVESLG